MMLESSHSVSKLGVLATLLLSVALSCASGRTSKAGGAGGRQDEEQDGAGGAPPTPEDPEGKPAACTSEEPCQVGPCVGDACGERWECGEPTRTCEARVAAYCSCEGETFWASANCPDRPIASEGLCPGAVGCNPNEVRGDCDRERPECPTMQVPQVEEGCWTGECVPVETCACSSATDCPEDEFTCWLFAKHCGPYVR